MQTGVLHLGNHESCKLFLQSLDRSYVYLLRRPDNRPFYVGKGGGGQNKYRVLDHENEARHPNNWRSNAHKLNVIRAVWRTEGKIIYEIDSVHENEMDAYMREAVLISHYKRLHEGGTLTNLAPGGGSINGASPLSKERHAATLGGIPVENPERAAINGFVLSIYPGYAKKLSSIPIKPLSQHRAKPTLVYPNKSIGKTVRQAAALVASACANGISMEAGCTIPRLLTIEGVEAVIESGVTCDIASSGFGTIVSATKPRDESIILTPAQAAEVVGLIGLQKCTDLGLLHLC